jgi:hypothetical protein
MESMATTCRSRQKGEPAKKNLFVLMLSIVGACALHTACTSQDSAPTYDTAGVGEVASISGKTVCAPTAAALKRILDTNSEEEFLRTSGIEARSVGWIGPVFLATSDRVTVLKFDSIQVSGSRYSSVPVAQVRVEEISGGRAAGTLNPNEREGWILLKAIDRGR